MHPPSRTRRILKWTGARLTLLIFAMWMASLWYVCGFKLTSTSCIGLKNQGVMFNRHPIYAQIPQMTEFYRIDWRGIRFDSPQVGLAKQQQPGIYGFFVPYWLLLLLTAIPTAWLWHRDRGWKRPGCCLRCGYDLTGNTSGVCPECGDKVHPPAVLADSECGEPKPPPATV